MVLEGRRGGQRVELDLVDSQRFSVSYRLSVTFSVSKLRSSYEEMLRTSDQETKNKNAEESLAAEGH